MGSEDSVYQLLLAQHAVEEILPIGLEYGVRDNVVGVATTQWGE
jgi:hypothetical protein